MSSTNKNKVLEVQDLHISFTTDNGLVKAVRGVSFDLYEGETLCIVGESGSGKSVTSKAIMGILANNAVVEGGIIPKWSLMIINPIIFFIAALGCYGVLRLTHKLEKKAPVAVQ